jgi:hypothetical protein
MTKLRPLAARWLPVVLITTVSLAQGAVYAHTPDLVSAGNRWTITSYNDASPTHDHQTTQEICFKFIGIVGTHQQYEWWSTTFPDWNGIATQEGDQIFMHGDWAEDRGHNTMQWELVTVSPKDIGAGHWIEWWEDGKLGQTVGFRNTLLTRVGRCRLTIDEARYLPLPLDETGKPMESPSGNLKLEQPK